MAKKLTWKMIAGRGAPEDFRSGGIVNWGYDDSIPLSVYKYWKAELDKHIGEKVMVTGGGGPGVYGMGTLASATITKFYDGKPALKALIKDLDTGKSWRKPEDFEPWINSWQIWVKVPAGKSNPVRNQMQSVFVVTPVTRAAKNWVKENVPLESWQWLGPGFAVEHGFIADLTAGMIEAGLVVNKDFRVS